MLNHCVLNNGRVSALFTCNVAVRQGENLSPVLFALCVSMTLNYIRVGILKDWIHYPKILMQ